MINPPSSEVVSQNRTSNVTNSTLSTNVTAQPTAVEVIGNKTMKCAKFLQDLNEIEAEYNKTLGDGIVTIPESFVTVLENIKFLMSQLKEIEIKLNSSQSIILTLDFMPFCRRPSLYRNEKASHAEEIAVVESNRSGVLTRNGRCTA